MGVVYKAEQIIQQRVVALKMVRSGVRDSGVILRFQQEAKAVSALSHPNIVTVFECAVTDDGTPYLAMEYIDGKTLAESDVKLTIAQAVDVFIQLCDALGHAHEKGVIHRDLKPGNIVSANWDEEDGRIVVKILDFGIAKLLPSSGKDFLELTRTGQPIGSPSYMSPEQCRAEELDIRSDIYSLGCVMYKVLAGRTMFDEASLFNVINQHLKEVPRPFNEVCPDARIPIQLEEIVFKALEKKRENRYQSMREMQAALESFRSGASTTGQFLSAHLKRMVRYRLRATLWLVGWLAVMVLFVVVSFHRVLQQRYEEFRADQAREEARMATEKRTQAENNNNRALGLINIKDRKAARSILQDALSIERGLPDRTDCNLVRADTREQLGEVLSSTENPADVQEAQLLLEQANKLFQDNGASKGRIAKVQMSLAEVKLQTGDLEGAKKLSESACNNAEGNSELEGQCLAHQAAIEAEQSHFDRARKLFLSALEMYKKSGLDKTSKCKDVYLGLARSAQQLRQKEEAAQWIQKANECR